MRLISEVREHKNLAKLYDASNAGELISDLQKDMDCGHNSQEQKNATLSVRAVDSCTWLVKSSKGPGEYVVIVKDCIGSCTCPQFRYRSHLGDCKHIRNVKAGRCEQK